MCNYSQIPGFWGHSIKRLDFVLRETGNLGILALKLHTPLGLDLGSLK
jgi:hypothetical protein